MKLYTAARVLTGDGEVLPGGGVVTGDGVIKAVGRLGELPTAAERVDFPHGTLLPGLIDAHVHLAMDGGDDPVSVLRAADDTALLHTMRRNARALLAAGVTTARDLGARGFLDVVLRDEITDGVSPGPRLLTATRPLTSPGGHCWYLGGECRGVDAIRRGVRERHLRGADLLKIMVTGGNTTPGSKAWLHQFTDAELATAVSEAHSLGIPVAAHAHGADGIRAAVVHGMDTIEHCTWQTEHGFDGYLPALADAIAEAGIPVCGTFHPLLARDEAYAEQRRRVVTDMRRRGVAFIAGTDAGIRDTPHSAYATALATMAGYGFTAAEVIRAATVDAAAALGVAGSTGSLTPGRNADLVAVHGDPLTDLSALAMPALVVARGREYRPERAARR
ncbi:amidohydrolase family protein [Streptomyces sp. NPDC048637]|uniref:metal-dependent hydrolase family protein n=1 Tax=Streptomyces sp. NPDC048637 TaxID=3155636 RepID=UPI00342CF706